MSGVGNISYTVFFSAITINLVGKKEESSKAEYDGWKWNEKLL